MASWLSVTHSYTAANRGAEYCDERVCLSVRVCVFVRGGPKKSGGRLKQDLDEDLQLHRILILLY